MKVALISYHYHPHPGYRSSLVYEYFRARAGTEVTFVHGDWDHQSKSVLPPPAEPSREAIPVPPYARNLSWRRIWSHLVFTAKVFRHPSLRDADLIYVCIPPSVSAVGPAWAAVANGKPWVLDLVDLWPEALPVSDAKKRLLQWSVGWLWIGLRNAFYARATRFVSHCRYFLDEIQLPEARTRFIPLAQSQPQLAEPVVGTRAPIGEEIRILVLGSINHVLDSAGLVRLLEALATTSKRRLVLEVLGAGESKAKLLSEVAQRTPSVTVVDHGMSFDPALKREIMARCHFGYNGYSAQTAIGITYKSIDFASQGLVFLNSVRGDLFRFVSEYGAGFNFVSGAEAELAASLLALDDLGYETLRAGSQRLYVDLFRLESFHARMDQLVGELVPQAQNSSR